MSRLRRPYLHSRFFFVTTNIRKGLRTFSDAEYGLLAESLIRMRQLVPVSICGYCFMPDHVHMILFPQEQTTISDAIMRFKVAASRRIRPLRGEAFWQARFYDRALRTRGEYDEALDYIHMNPVRQGLSEVASQWSWSSARWFCERIGPVPVDEVRLPVSPDDRI